MESGFVTFVERNAEVELFVAESTGRAENFHSTYGQLLTAFGVHCQTTA